MNKRISSIILFLITINFFSFSQADVKDGYTYFYYPNGQISSEGLLRDGKPDGYWKTFYVNVV